MKKITETIDRFVDEKILLGCGIQIIKDNEMICSYVKGNAALDGSVKMEPDTRIRLYSVSKTMTMAGFLKLYEKGYFKLDDPIAEYLPEFSDPRVCISKTDISQTRPVKRPITIRHLATMTSGIPYMGLSLGTGAVEDELYRQIDEMAEKNHSGMPVSLANYIQSVSEVPLCFDPGEHWKYGLSHAVLGRLTEVLTGKSLGEYLREEIWEPTGLKNTCFNTELPKGEFVADQIVFEKECEPFGYRKAADESSGHLAGGSIYGSKTDVLPMCKIGIEVPCAGIVSTLNDIGQFARMLANGGEVDGNRILGRKTLDLARMNHLNERQLADFKTWNPDNNGFTYGLGYRTFQNSTEAGFYLPEGSFGWDGATGCYLLANPEKRFAFVFTEQSFPHHVSYTIPRLIAAMNSEGILD